MQVKFRQCKSPKNVVDKKFKDTTYTVNCILKDNTSVINPTLVITHVPSTVHLAEYNYCQINDLNRSYFITDVQHDKNTTIISCHVDVLMSYKNDIKNSIQIVSRQESLKNRYIVDDRLPIHSDSSYTTQDINIPELMCPNGGILLQVATG